MTADGRLRGHINVEDLDGGVRTIEIDRPDKRGALTTPMMRDLAEQVAVSDREAAVRAVLLCSTGPAFCAGADLTALSGAAPVDDPGARVLEVLAHMTTPVVAAVQGAAVGMGATMLLHCDVVYATSHASLRMPFLQLGLTPEGGATVLLPHALGPARAKRLLMLGEPMTAAEAHATGLWTEVVPGEELRARAEAAARTMAQLPASAFAVTKQLLRPQGFAEQFAHESLAFSHQRLQNQSAGAQEAAD
jgi:enoyl-CoA hydratase/carnithine racemase